MEQPDTRFAWNGDVALAYQALGWGERNLLHLPGSLSNVDVMWEDRLLAFRTRMERATMGPGAMVAETWKFTEIDIRAVLPTIHVPTLVVHGERIRTTTRAARSTSPIT